MYEILYHPYVHVRYVADSVSMHEMCYTTSNVDVCIEPARAPVIDCYVIARYGCSQLCEHKVALLDHMYHFQLLTFER